MSIATEITRLQTAKSNIKTALENKGIVVPSTTKIDGYAQLINNNAVDIRVVATFNVTSKTSPTRISSGITSFSAIEIDGVAQSSVVSAYTFSTIGVHTVKYTLANPTTVGNYTFNGCTNLISLDIPDKVTTIGSGVCSGCTSLSSCTIGNNVTSIGYSAFTSCTNLKSVNVPDSVTAINPYAFYNCTSLASCTIGKSVATINSYAFYNCTSLIGIYIPNSVRTIAGGAFQGCTNLTSADISSGVTTIGNNVFQRCNRLIKVDIPDSVTSIGSGVCSGCTSLSSCTIGNNVTSIGYRFFYYCTSLANCTIGNNVTNIGTYAFRNCTKLTSIDIPDKVTTIEASAFYACSSLSSCTIGSGVTSIGDSAFYACSSLITITSTATAAPTIGASTFRNVKTYGTLRVSQSSTGYDTWMGTSNYYLGKYGWTRVDYVEIGGLKWSTTNVGATGVTDYGLYFQWGDTSGYTAAQVGSGSGKKYFGWSDYKYCSGAGTADSAMTKYNSTDGKTVLDLSDDAARANMGGSWRMPTTAEYAALGAAVNSAWTADYQGSGVRGLVLTDKTDSSKVLFFPAAGNCYNGSVLGVGSGGYYWSSSVFSSYVQGAYYLSFGSRSMDWETIYDRYYGFHVRGVVG